jgi:nucleoid DNA-binding protein
MQPHKYFQKFAATIVKRSGLSRATVEAVLPHVFDEIRYQLTEGTLCVPIESFGTFTIKDVPEHEFLYHRGDVKEVHTVPAKRVLKFAPTRNMRREIEARQYDPQRKSFVHHPADPKISKRHDLRYKPAKGYNRDEGAWGSPIYKKKSDGRSKMEDGTE